MVGRLKKWGFAAAAAAALAAGIPVIAAAKHDPPQGQGGAHGQGVGNAQAGAPANASANSNAPKSTSSPTSAIKHVLLISVDGLHQSDLNWWVANHPGTALANLALGGAQYTSAHTPVPSDSDPGMTAQMTGGDPKTTGVFYDVEYSRAVYEAGTTSCTGPTGGDVVYDSPDDNDVTRLDAGQTPPLTGLPDSILQMTSTPQDVLNPATFPVDPATCKPIAPWQYLKVNTIFNVAHDHNLITAWSDKHPVYTSFDGPAGNGITDSFDPEIDSNALLPGGAPWPGPTIAWTGDNAATMQYDDYKVQAVLNWIVGWNHQHTIPIGTPAIFGMNFQTVSTAEKLPTSDGLMGGDFPGTITPGPLLQRALQYISDRLQQMQTAIANNPETANSTAIVLSAKHGQSPQDPNQLTRIDDGPIMAGVNSAWDALHPGAVPLVVAGTDDDAIMWWLSDRSSAAAEFVKHYLWTHTATGNTATGGTRTLPHSGLRKLYAGPAETGRYFGVPASDPRHPDVWGIVQVGVVYTGGHKKIAEHGGANPADRDVPIVVYGPGIQPQVSGQWVETTQIAPTIVSLLGLDPNELQAVDIQHTQVLPGLG